MSCAGRSAAGTAWLGIVVGVAWIVLVHLGRLSSLTFASRAQADSASDGSYIARWAFLITVLCACMSRALARRAASRRRRVVVRPAGTVP